MFRLEKDFRFEAAHRLPHHDGKCARLHGHSWKGTLVVEEYELITAGPKQGMAMDFGDLGALIKPLLDNYLDHYDLNETLELVSPTSEQIAKWIWIRLHQDCPQLVAVIIEETCTARCESRPVYHNGVRT